MKVGFDISQIAHAGGVVTYTQNLAEQLSIIDGIDPVFFYSSLRKPYKGNLPNVKSYMLPPSLFEPLFNKLRNIPIEKFVGQIDIFHSSDWVQPPTKAKKVTAYHDVIPLKYPQWSLRKIVDVQKRRLKIVENEIDMVIAVSETTKRDLMEISNIPDEKITVIYEGVNKIYKPQQPGDIEVFKKKYNLPDEFVLAIGGIGERRNTQRIKQASWDYNLVITGENLPYLEEREMPLLYSSAKVLIYASLYEGFGLPILEAMACGVPVVTSNKSSMIEVSGKAAVLSDPEDVSDIKKKLEQVFFDEEQRKELIDKGLKRAGEFSWEKCAAETFNVYKSLVS